MTVVKETNNLNTHSDGVGADLSLTALMNKYNMNGPRYTSYPTALEFDESFSNSDFCEAVASSTNDSLSLYIHIPFCHKLCYYCGCNKIVTRHKHKADIYLDYLEKEVIERSATFSLSAPNKNVVQIHFGGGTPSFLSAEQFTRIMTLLKSQFKIHDDVEISIEIDPREIELSLLDHLYQLGFSRLSFGIQDTNIVVQEAINRIQDLGFIKQLIARGKTLGFKSINLDIIYGLPHQTMTRFDKTLNDILDCDPDRISLFSYAHLPSRFSAQRKIKDEWLPSAELKMSLMLRAIEVLDNNGYVAIGMDHFAKPQDELAKAQQDGRLHRNFQGYSTLHNSDLVGFGVSSISSVGASFSQNAKDLKSYYLALDSEQHALERGLKLDLDDLIRGDAIKQLMCNFVLDIAQFETLWSIDFLSYFEAEIATLKPFIDDKMISIEDSRIVVHSKAKLFIRTICMAFDKYMVKQLNQQRFSRVI